MDRQTHTSTPYPYLYPLDRHVPIISPFRLGHPPVSQHCYPIPQITLSSPDTLYPRQCLEHPGVPVSLISVPSRDRPGNMHMAHGDSMGTVRTTGHRHPGVVPTSAAVPTPHPPGAESTPGPWQGLTPSPPTQGEPCQPSHWRGTLYGSLFHSMGYRANTPKPTFPFLYPLPSQQDPPSSH